MEMNEHQPSQGKCKGHQPVVSRITTTLAIEDDFISYTHPEHNTNKNIEYYSIYFDLLWIFFAFYLKWGEIGAGAGCEGTCKSMKIMRK